MDDARTDVEAAQMRQVIEAIHCPVCHKKAAYMGIKWVAGSFYVIPVYSCDTDGCEFHIDSDAAWTLDLRG
jgi:hypothetical protein